MSNVKTAYKTALFCSFSTQIVGMNCSFNLVHSQLKSPVVQFLSSKLVQSIFFFFQLVFTQLNYNYLLVIDLSSYS